MRIRAFQKDDFSAYHQMAADFYSGGATLFPLHEDRLTDAFHQAMTNSPYLAMYMLEEEGTPVGYVQLAFTYSCEAGGKVCWVEELYIKDAFRGRGFGKSALAWVSEAFQGECVRFRLEVCPHNTRAMSLYEGMGYRVLPYRQMIKGE